MGFGGLQPSQLSPVVPSNGSAPVAPADLKLQAPAAPDAASPQPDMSAALQALEAEHPEPAAVPAPDYAQALELLDAPDALDSMKPEPSATTSVGGASGAYGVVQLKDGTFGVVDKGKVRDLSAKEKSAAATIAHSLRVLGPVAGGAIGSLANVAGPAVGAAGMGTGAVVGGEAIHDLAGFFERLSGNTPHERSTGERTLEAVGGAAGGELAGAFMKSGLPETAGARAATELAAKAAPAVTEVTPGTLKPAEPVNVIPAAPIDTTPVTVSTSGAPARIVQKTPDAPLTETPQKLGQEQSTLPLTYPKLSADASEKEISAALGHRTPIQMRIGLQEEMALRKANDAEKRAFIKKYNSTEAIDPDKRGKLTTAQENAFNAKLNGQLKTLRLKQANEGLTSRAADMEIKPEQYSTETKQDVLPLEVPVKAAPGSLATEAAPAEVVASPSKAIQESERIVKGWRSILPSKVDLTTAAGFGVIGQPQLAATSLARKAMIAAIKAHGPAVIAGSKRLVNNAVEVLGKSETEKLLSPALRNLIVSTGVSGGEIPKPEPLTPPAATLNDVTSTNANRSPQGSASMPDVARRDTNAYVGKVYEVPKDKPAYNEDPKEFARLGAQLTPSELSAYVYLDRMKLEGRPMDEYQQGIYKKIQKYRKILKEISR